jgi:GNAT superfamily N-acetyltransferase
MMQVEIKRIREFDEKLIAQLFLQIGVKNIVPNRLFFKDEKNILLVAYDRSQPCGFLYAYLLDDIRRDRGKLFLYSIDVFESHRNEGVGTQLIGALKQVAEEHSCNEIFVITNKNNVAAVKLYEKTGGSAEHDDDVVFVYQ